MDVTPKVPTLEATKVIAAPEFFSEFKPGKFLDTRGGTLSGRTAEFSEAKCPERSLLCLTLNDNISYAFPVIWPGCAMPFSNFSL